MICLFYASYLLFFAFMLVNMKSMIQVLFSCTNDNFEIPRNLQIYLYISIISRHPNYYTKALVKWANLGTVSCEFVKPYLKTESF